MSRRINWSLLPTAAASLGMVTAGFAASFPAVAQTTPPPGQPAAATGPNGEPPARVGWLSNISGSVSFHSAGQNQWVTATQNFPIATGDAVWTQPQASASIMVDSSRIALAAGTEVTAQEIDQSTITTALSQGEVFLDIVSLQQGQGVTVQTPRGTAQINANGEYEIYAGDGSTPTYVTAVTGSVQFTGLGASPQTIGAQQTLIVSGTNPVQGQLGAMQQDAFLTTMLQQVAPPPPPTAAQAPPVCARMTGATVLTQYGTWRPQPQYGTVWFPHVASGWVPYRDGHWAYVQPWGWTWVDNAAWGFAPFHYGRWSQFNGQWGWIPQPVAAQGYGQGYGYGYSYNQNQGYYADPGYQAPAPVYAPALVTFLGAAAGAAIGVFAANALSSGSIGWAPLGPQEAYYPPYRVNQRTFQAYNQPYVPHYDQFVQRNVTFNNNRVEYRNEGNGQGGGQPQFANRQGATFVPANVMMNSRPVRGAEQPVPQGNLQAFRPAAGQALPRPAAAQIQAGRPSAPGPEIRPFAAGARPGAPALVPHAQVAPTFQRGTQRPVAGQPGNPAQPGAVRPVVAQPGAVPPGAMQAHGVPNVPPGAAANEAPKPQFRPATPGAQPGARPATPQVGAAQPGAVPARGAERAGTQAPGAARNGTPNAQVRPAAPAAAAAAPRAEAARPTAAPRVEAPRAEAARPAAAPRVTAAPRAQPAPRSEAPRPAPAPRVEAPRAAPRVEAPRPAAPRAEAPRPQAPRPAQGHAEVRPPQGKR